MSVEVRIFDPPEAESPIFRSVGRATDAVSVSTIERHWTPGSFTLDIPTEARHAEKMSIGRLVLIDGGFWGIIDDVSMAADSAGDMLTVSGRQLISTLRNLASGMHMRRWGFMRRIRALNCFKIQLEANVPSGTVRIYSDGSIRTGKCKAACAIHKHTCISLYSFCVKSNWKRRNDTVSNCGCLSYRMDCNVHTPKLILAEAGNFSCAPPLRQRQVVLLRRRGSGEGPQGKI